MQLDRNNGGAGVTRFRGAALCFALAAAAGFCAAGCAHLLSRQASAATPAAYETGPADAASLPRARLLTAQQYANIIRDVFGADIRAGTPIPPMRRTDGLLEISSASVGVTAGQIM